MGTGKVVHKKYLRLSKGKVRYKADPSDPEAVKVEVKNDAGEVVRVKYEIQDDYVEGLVMDVYIQESQNEKFSPQLSVEIEDGIDTLIAQLSTESSMSGKLLNKFCNPDIDWTDEVYIQPYYFEEENKSQIVVRQHGVDIEPYFTKDDPKGCPGIPAELIGTKDKKLKAELKLKIIEMNNFIEDHFYTHILPVIKGVKKADPNRKATPVSKPITVEKENNGPEPPDDDLPF